MEREPLTLKQIEEGLKNIALVFDQDYWRQKVAQDAAIANGARFYTPGTEDTKDADDNG